ncbi:MAG: UDP-N-acetylmuramoyl-tripeptide--D-alanyl-D-alanine ligase [Clostridia bacterium]|nr:UDP-N-acetylmuramoyl-tripeptide--D-alanyl-D-alanine ligase [Clostridia bacterium]
MIENKFFMVLIYIITVAASITLSARLLLHYFQLESYQFRGYFLTLRRQWHKAFAPGMLLAIVFIVCQAIIWRLDKSGNHPWLWFIADAVVLATAWLLNRIEKKQPQKKKFVMTARVKRLYVALAIASALCAVCAALWAVGLSTKFSGPQAIGVMLILTLPFLLMPLIVALSGVLALPVERLIFRLYFRDAEKKLMANDRLIRIGITGSYGKTSTKFVLANILAQKYNVLATPASFNTPMGLTRVIRERLLPSHQVFIGEMGARHVGEIKELCSLVHPTIGILTSVGPQHLDTFGSIERIKKTKYELIDALPNDGMAFFANDDGIVTALYEATDKPKQLIGKAGSDAWAEDVAVNSNGSSFTLCFRDGEKIFCQTRLLGKHNIANIVCGAAVARYLGLSLRQIEQGILTLTPIEHRLQIVSSVGNVTVIDDAFNTNPTSSKEALHVLSMFPKRRIIVTPGMVELGEQEAEYNREFGQHMAGCVDIAILVGKRHTEPIREGLLDQHFEPSNIFVCSSLEEAIAQVRALARPGDTVMYENDLPDHYNDP